MPTFEDPPHPQIFISGLPADDPRFLAMARLAARAVEVLETDEIAQSFRLAEWDLAVAFDEPGHLIPGHIHTLTFGLSSSDVVLRAFDDATLSTRARIDHLGRQPSQTVHVPDDLPVDLDRLVQKELLPWLREQPSRPFLAWPTNRSYKRHGGGLRDIASTHSSTRPQPFVLDADGHVIAGALPRGDGGWRWALPHLPEHPELWLAAQLAWLHEIEPERFPQAKSWRHREAWMTREELHVATRLDSLRARERSVLQDLAREESELAAAAAAADQVADNGLRRLLTGQGDDLSAAVQLALTTLGFDVTDIDAQTEDGTAKVEDLQLRSPDDPSWTNLTEIKGYTAGAKARDLQTIARYSGLFARRTGAEPVSQWYVVNQFIGTDPDTRQLPLTGADEQIEEFASWGGLIVDTKDLFRLIRSVEEGHLTPAQARTSLVTQRGRFESPPMSSGSA